MKKTILFIFFTYITTIGMKAADPVKVSFTEAGSNDVALVEAKAAAPIFYSADDHQVVATAAAMLASDVKSITGVKPSVTATLKTCEHAILAGTLGRSPLINDMVAAGKLSTTNIEGQWETFGISVIDNPTEGISRAVVVVGSDPRGTAFGLLELSRMMGVSPLIWWDDVAPEPHDMITITGGHSVYGPPSVKYRGIFINDEDWGFTPWARTKMDTDKNNVGPKTYERVFQLLLRLKANYLWPAMHGCTKAFWYYKDNPQMARKYDIVMGSSHCEQMLRNNVDEWNNNFATEYPGVEKGEWNWNTNSAVISRYWADRVKESKNTDAIYTLGMRGIHDSGMPGYNTIEEKAAAMKQIIAHQRSLIKENLDKDPTTVPQIFCPYKEALDIYRQGISLPDDVTLLWADDNYSFIRQLSNPTEQKRQGGGGVYYHFSYWGPPQCWLWLASTPPALTWFEMMKAYELNCKDVWVFNVGDIKPQEMEVAFALDFAWNVHSVDPANPGSYMRRWAAETFGEALADEVYAIKKEYYRIVASGKPEFEYNITYTPDEMLQRMAWYEALVERTKTAAASVPARLKDAWFQLMTYPIEAAAAMDEKVMTASLSFLYAQYGMATEAAQMSNRSKAAYKRIVQLTNTYNNSTAKGKWNGMMSYKPLGEAKFNELPTATEADVKESEFTLLSLKNTTVIPGSQCVATNGSADFLKVEGLGDAGNALTIWPLNMKKYGSATSAPYADYKVNVKSGLNTIEVHCLPSFPLYQGLDLRFAISIDGGTAQTRSIKTEAEKAGDWSPNVVRGYSNTEYTYTADKDKEITVRIYFLDPGLVFSGLKVTNSKAEDCTSKLLNPDFEYKAKGVKNDGTTVRGCPYGWKSKGTFSGSSWGINNDGGNFTGKNLCWVNSSPFPADFRLYQDVTGVEPGIYMLSCRLGVPGKYTNVRLFANKYVTYFGQESDYEKNLTDGEINTFAGNTEHSATLKEVSVMFCLKEGEKLSLGIATSNRYGDGTKATNNDGWFKVDNFRLEYVGPSSTDGVSQPEASRPVPTILYNLWGRQMNGSAPLSAGIYIRDHKKFIVK